MTSPLASAARRAGPVALAGIVSNGLAVVVTVGIARLLGSREYGSLIQLFGLLLILQMPGSALLVAVVRRIAAWDSHGRSAEVDAWVSRARRTALVAIGATALAAFVVQGWVADQLGLRGPGGVAPILVTGAVWGAMSLERGVLQSRLAFGALARNIGVEATVRTAGILVLVAAGGGVTGATCGLLAGIGAAALHGRRAAGRVLAAGPVPASGTGDAAAGDPMVALDAAVAGTAAAEPGPVSLETGVGAGRALLSDAGLALGALALLATLQSLDVIVLGRQAPQHSGDYAAVSVASKSLVFLAIVLAGYLLPEAATRHLRGEHALRQLGAALGLVAVPAVALVGVGVAVPHLFLSVFFGERLADASGALVWLALAMACLAAAVLLTHYLLGVGRGRHAAAVLAAGAVATAALLAAANGRPVTTARTDLVCQATIAAVLGFLVARTSRDGRRSGSAGAGGAGSRPVASPLR